MSLFDGFAGSALGALSGFLGGESANKASLQSTREQMAFQEDMANTSYQRVVADLNAAGLSPMLAYSKGGAPTPTGSTYKAENVGAAAVEGAAKGSQPSLTSAQVELARSQRDVNIQTARQVAEQARRTAYEVDVLLPTQLLYDSGVKASQINSNTASAAQNTALEKLTAQGKAPQTDTPLVRNIDQLLGRGVNALGSAKFTIDDMIYKMYNSAKSKLGIK